ncbi:hypothetical protein T492DRAFT_74363 [Pavlovales sp. CCMP2436]|nr:hypothetical protein T492DRAFT_74363 [Pavlovales sp. CCMP2436]
MSTWINDGECDSECNVEECNFDGSDCAHAVSECFHKPNGEDYRGRIATTSSGLLCQKWSAQFPHQHTTTHVNFPRWEFCSVPKPFEQCMANEVPTAAKSDSATPCVIDGPTPSGYGTTYAFLFLFLFTRLPCTFDFKSSKCIIPN